MENQQQHDLQKQQECVRKHGLAPHPGFGYIPSLTHRHDAESDHFGGFKFWHFLDVASDTARLAVNWAKNRLSDAGEAASGTMQKAKHALPVLRIASRALPFVGFFGESMHVATPWGHVNQDQESGKISSLKANSLKLFYGVYAATGILPLIAVPIKEGLTHAIRFSGLLEERYIPHTLAQEVQHAFFEDEHHHGHHHHHHGHHHHHHDYQQNREDLHHCLEGGSAQPQDDQVIGDLVHFHAIGENVKDCPICAQALTQLHIQNAHSVTPPANIPKMPAKLADNAELA